MHASVSIRGAEENDNAQAVGNTPPRGMDVLDAAYMVGHNYPGGIPALAPRLGMSPNVLASKLNPNTDSHLLSLKQAQALMDVTNNDAILFALADHRGYDLVRTLPANTEDPQSLYWQAAAAFAEYQAATAEAMEQGVSRNSLKRAANRCADAMAHMHNLLATLRARLPAEPSA